MAIKLDMSWQAFQDCLLGLPEQLQDNTIVSINRLRSDRFLPDLIKRNTPYESISLQWLLDDGYTYSENGISYCFISIPVSLAAKVWLFCSIKGSGSLICTIAPYAILGDNEYKTVRGKIKRLSIKHGLPGVIEILKEYNVIKN